MTIINYPFFEVTHAMQLYRSAFHPDSGELQNIFGRMSFQVNYIIMYMEFLLLIKVFNHLIEIPFSLFFSASSVVSSYGPTSATREHEKRILETILPPDLRHLVHGNSSTALHVNTYIFLLCTVG